MGILNKLSIFFLLTLFSSFFQSTDIGYASNSSAEIISESDSIKKNTEILIGVKFKLDPGWHTYWINPGDSGDKASFNWTLPKGFKISDPMWPQPELIPYPPLMTYGYNDEAIIVFKLESSNYLDERSEISLKTKWLACSDVCIPQEADIKLSLSKSSFNNLNPNSKILRKVLEREVPKEYSEKVSSILTDESLILSFLVEKEDINSEILFFPYKYGLINYSDSQKIEINNESVSLIIKKSSAKINLSSVSGLIQFSAKDKKTSYFFNSPLQGKKNNEISVVVALLFAFIGGLILNLMPCVFPVISLKILNFIEISSNKKEIKIHGLMFSLGSILTFLIIGLSILGLRSTGEQIGWGFQLQSPVFVSILIYLFIFMSGLFLFSMSFGSFFTRAGNLLSASSGYKGSFGTGFLAVLVATPCTAPFMGSALGLALLQPNFYSILIFLSLGLGFCAPYLILSFYPSLLNRFPAPGIWMENFKRFMAIPMFLTAVWLLWVLSNQVSISEMYQVIISSILIILLIILNSSNNFIRKNNILNNSIIIFSILFCFYFLPDNKSKISEADFSTSILKSAINKGPVFLNFTADWCITCKVNEQVALKDDNFFKLLESRNIKYIKADWTNRNSEITELLESFGRSGIPLYIYFPSKNAAPVILPEILNDRIIYNYLSKDY
jgi:thiol:disulfide interchange protein DsbD